jgi:hypothetical protein
MTTFGIDGNRLGWARTVKYIRANACMTGKYTNKFYYCWKHFHCLCFRVTRRPRKMIFSNLFCSNFAVWKSKLRSLPGQPTVFRNPLNTYLHKATLVCRLAFRFSTSRRFIDQHWLHLMEWTGHDLLLILTFAPDCCCCSTAASVPLDDECWKLKSVKLFVNCSFNSHRVQSLKKRLS